MTSLSDTVNFLMTVIRGRNILLAAFFLSVTCPIYSDDYEWQLPSGFPRPEVPADNPMNNAKVELGRRLFYDNNLSGDGSYSCASCHRQALAFTDGRPQAIGVSGGVHSRNTMSLTNVAYNPVFGWASKDLASLENQALVPMFNTQPKELGITQPGDGILKYFKSQPQYVARFKLAFPQAGNWVTLPQITQAIAAFERTLISGNSAYDQYLFYDDQDAISLRAREGMKLFFSKRLGCSQCHSGINLSGPAVFPDLAPAAIEFHNTGLYEVYPAEDTGLFLETSVSADKGRFRAPTLRNIAVTAPYMHDGSISSLAEVIDHYAAGGRTITTGANAGVGSHNPRKSRFIKGFAISLEEKQDLLEFLRALTDEQFITDRRFSNPHQGTD